MNFKEIFGAKKASEEKAHDDSQSKLSEPIDSAQAQTSELLQELISLEDEGKLSRPLGEYLEDEAFCELLIRYGAEAAVVIYDLRSQLKNAEKKARADAQTEMQKLRHMPRPIRGGSPVEQETDFSKLTSEEFENLKKRIAKGR